MIQNYLQNHGQDRCRGQSDKARAAAGNGGRRIEGRDIPAEFGVVVVGMSTAGLLPPFDTEVFQGFRVEATEGCLVHEPVFHFAARVGFPGTSSFETLGLGKSIVGIALGVDAFIACGTGIIVGNQFHSFSETIANGTIGGNVGVDGAVAGLIESKGKVGGGEGAALGLADGMVLPNVTGVFARRQGSGVNVGFFIGIAGKGHEVDFGKNVHAGIGGGIAIQQCWWSIKGNGGGGNAHLIVGGQGEDSVLFAIGGIVDTSGLNPVSGSDFGSPHDFAGAVG